MKGPTELSFFPMTWQVCTGVAPHCQQYAPSSLATRCLTDWEKADGPDDATDVTSSSASCTLRFFAPELLDCCDTGAVGAKTVGGGTMGGCEAIMEATRGSGDAGIINPAGADSSLYYD